MKKMNLPNRLTVLRICLVPIFVLFMLLDFKAAPLLALIVFVSASYTDHLDGKIARKRGIVTNFGKFLDPIADKILVLSALICLLPLKLCHPVVLIIVISRELLISSLRLIAASQNIVIAAGISGKIKTIIQMLSIGVVIFLMTINNFSSNGIQITFISNILMWVQAAVCIYSGAEYMLKNYKLINSGE